MSRGLSQSRQGCELEFAGVQHENEHHSLGSRSNIADGLLEQQARQHHTLAEQRERLVADIRALPGFERFLLPKSFNQHSALVRFGDVVFLNASERSYDQIAGMQGQLGTLLLNKGLRDEDDPDRGARLVRLGANDVFKSVLSDLWNKVVRRILDVLGLSTPPVELSHVFWCPTGRFTFLPIHPAGIYHRDNRGTKISDFVISSYIPTTSALQEQHQQDLPMDSGKIRFLAVPQPSADGQRHLYGVKEEMEIIKVLTSSSPFIDFKEADGTVDNVLTEMKQSDWAHFCCHGTQDRSNPLDSGLLLADHRRLKLSDIVQLSRPRGGLAFLSACQTAMPVGDEQLSDEAIHLAAGMLLVGYDGVIATMWSIMDNDAPRVTRELYGELFGDGRTPDSRRAAGASHHVIKRLRDSGAPFLSWVPFVHYGL